MKTILNADEMRYAAIAGVEREIEALTTRGAKEAHGLDPEEAKDWNIHIEGAMGEYVVAKYLGTPWDGGHWGGPDVGLDIEVRTTPYYTGKLILHKKDRDERTFYLVTGKNGSYQIRGWIKAADGKLEEYWGTFPDQPNRPCYRVPQSALHPLEDSNGES